MLATIHVVTVRSVKAANHNSSGSRCESARRDIATAKSGECQTNIIVIKQSDRCLPKEEVVGIRREAAVLKQPQQVIVLAMDVTW